MNHVEGTVVGVADCTNVVETTAEMLLSNVAEHGAAKASFEKPSV